MPGDRKNDRIYNGAMDDGSGVASLIEVATLVRAGKLAPKRSLLFVAVTGEGEGCSVDVFRGQSHRAQDGDGGRDQHGHYHLPLFPLKILGSTGWRSRASAVTSGK